MIRTLAVLVAALLTLTLTACGSEGGDSEPTGATSSSTAESSPESKSETKTAESKSETKTAEAKKAEKKKEKPKKVKKKSDGKDALPGKVEKAVKDNLGGRDINDACDYSDMQWHCFFDGYKSATDSRIEVRLSFPGDVSDSDKKEHAEQARLHTFNLAGGSVEKLDAVTSFDDGVDSGTTYRRDVPILN